MSTLERARSHIHPVVFPVSAGAIVLFVIYGAVFTDHAEETLLGIRDWINETTGWVFIAAIAFFLVFCLWLTISRYAKVKLGPDDSTPDYSYLTWFAMLFSAGMGIGLVYWGVAEPIFHYLAWPPPWVEGGTEAAAREAMIITYHHWGLGAWSVYAVLGLSLAYFGFRHDLPMTIRSALYPLIGDRIQGWPGNLVDTLAIFGTLFGIATSLGLGVAQINSGLNSLFDVPIGAGTQVLLIAIITAVATISVVTGLDRGIRRLSEVNITTAALLMLFVAITGPTVLLASAYVENLGNYVGGFVDALFRSGAYAGEDGAGFVSAWTIFYWAWWISWAPFVGTFIARISRGRTIREFVLGVLIVPALVSFLWFTVMGNTAIIFQADGTVDIAAAMDEGGSAAAMFAMLEGLPLATITSIVTIFVVVVFFVTSSDSGSFVVDMIASGGDLNPPVSQRVFWAVTEGAVAAILLWAGGLDALQAGAIATGLPFTLVLVVVVIGIMKGLRSEQPGMTLEAVAAAPLIEGEADRREARSVPPTPGAPSRTGSVDEPADQDR